MLEQCSGDSTLATCVNSVWKRESCPADKPICQNNTCVERPKDCTPGDKKCISEKQTQKCNGNGFWEDDNFCSGTSTCFNGDCVEKCSPGEKKCVTDSMAYVCGVSGYWESVECTGGKICSEGECKTCLTGQRRCKDDKNEEVCNDGTWKTYKCDYNYCSKEDNQCLYPGSSCLGVMSFCLDERTLVYCSGKKFGTVSCSNRGCLSSSDGTGANCKDNGNTNETSGDSCSSVGSTKSGQFARGDWSSYDADCVQCKRMPNGQRLWVPVDESNCK